MTTDTTPLARTGQPLHKHGRKTYDTLLDSLAEHLRDTTWRAASIPRITTNAGRAPGAFYHYFPDLESALLALVHRERDAGRALSEHLEAITALIAAQPTPEATP